MVEMEVSCVYRRPLRVVILDWAGTTVVFGCNAAVVVLPEL